MIEHVSVPVSDCAAARAFYTTTFAPLGYKLNTEFAPDAADFMEVRSPMSFYVLAYPHDFHCPPYLRCNDRYI